MCKKAVKRMLNKVLEQNARGRGKVGTGISRPAAIDSRGIVSEATARARRIRRGHVTLYHGESKGVQERSKRPTAIDAHSCHVIPTSLQISLDQDMAQLQSSLPRRLGNVMNEYRSGVH